MASIVWRPIFRFVPRDGIPETLDVNVAFSDTSGATKTEVGHKPERTARTDVNRDGRSVTWGYRGVVKFDVEVVDTAKHANVSALLARLTDRDGYTSYLSMDSGVTYREVELLDYRGPSYLGGKVFAGAKYEFDVQSVELLSSVPAVGSGVW